jgi:hypothetical protein
MLIFIMRKILATLFVFVFVASNSNVAANSLDITCAIRKMNAHSNPDWSASKDANLHITMKWVIPDPNQCIVGLNPIGDQDFRINYKTPDVTFPTTWKYQRIGENVLVTANFDIPRPWLDLWALKNDASSPVDPSQNSKNVYSFPHMLVDKNGDRKDMVYGMLSGQIIWGIWYQGVQKLDTSQCNYPIPDNGTGGAFKKDPWLPIVGTQVVNHGTNPTVNITIANTRNCIFTVFTGPIEPAKDFHNRVKYLAEAAFYLKAAIPYVDNMVKESNQLVQVGFGDFAQNAKPGTNISTYVETPLARIVKAPKPVPHSDVISQSGDQITISTKLDLSGSTSETGTVGIYFGSYFWYSTTGASVAGGWIVDKTSSTTYTAKYSGGGYIFPQRQMMYETRYISIPIGDLLISPAEKAAADKAAADKAAADKAAADKAAADKAAADKAAADKAAVSTIKTVTCYKKGLPLKKIKGQKPKCPYGYVKK